MKIETTAHAIRVRFAGPTDTKGSRWIATWEGWPANPRPVRRTFNYEYARGTGPENFATRVAQAFVDWLNKGPSDYTGDRDVFGHNVVRSVHVGALGPDEYAVLVDLADTRDT